MQISGPTKYFWYRETLDISADIESLDSFNWKIALCLVFCWLIVYLCIIKGITENPAVVYVGPFPFVSLSFPVSRCCLVEAGHRALPLLRPHHLLLSRNQPRRNVPRSYTPVHSKSEFYIYTFVLTRSTYGALCLSTY